MATASVDRDNLADLKDVVIASAYGRGHWLAGHLADQGWKVTLLDFTKALGPFSPEDYDGPFGLLETDLISGSQKTHWSTEFGPNTVQKVESGYSIWLKDGPIEGHSQLATFYAQERSISLAVRNYLHMVSDLSDIRLKPERTQLAKLPFENTWLVRFMHQFHSNEYSNPIDALDSSHATPFYSRYFVRALSSDSHRKSLQGLRDAQVEVIENPEVLSVKGQGDELVLLTMRADTIKTRSLVWGLTSFETARVAGELTRVFYKNTKLTPQWQWRKFIVSFDELPTEVPASFVLLHDPHLPWTHTNAVSVRSTSDYWICWMRLPSEQTKAEYFADQAKDLFEKIHQRLPWTGAKVEYSGDSNPAWFIYESGEKKALRTKIAKNIFISGPEHWDGVDPLSMYLNYKNVLGGLDSIRTVWDARQAKREAKEAMRLQKQKAKEQAKDEGKRQ